MIFAGVDPGKRGAIAWMTGTRSRIEICDVPLLPDGGYNIDAMASIIRQIKSQASDLTPCGLCPGEIVLTMEWVHAMPSDGKCSAFAFGEGFGIWRGVLGALGIEPQHADPAAWKRAMLAGLAPGKAAAVEQAARLFPAVDGQLRGERGGLKDGRAEALLLAEWGRRQYRIGRRAA